MACVSTSDGLHRFGGPIHKISIRAPVDMDIDVSGADEPASRIDDSGLRRNLDRLPRRDSVDAAFATHDDAVLQNPVRKDNRPVVKNKMILSRACLHKMTLNRSQPPTAVYFLIPLRQTIWATM